MRIFPRNLKRPPAPALLHLHRNDQPIHRFGEFIFLKLHAPHVLLFVVINPRLPNLLIDDQFGSTVLHRQHIKRHRRVRRNRDIPKLQRRLRNKQRRLIRPNRHTLSHGTSPPQVLPHFSRRTLDPRPTVINRRPPHIRLRISPLRENRQLLRRAGRRRRTARRSHLPQHRLPPIPHPTAIKNNAAPRRKPDDIKERDNWAFLILLSKTAKNSVGSPPPPQPRALYRHQLPAATSKEMQLKIKRCHEGTSTRPPGSNARPPPASGAPPTSNTPKSLAPEPSRPPDTRHLFRCQRFHRIMAIVRKLPARQNAQHELHPVPNA